MVVLRDKAGLCGGRHLLLLCIEGQCSTALAREEGDFLALPCMLTLLGERFVATCMENLFFGEKIRAIVTATKWRFVATCMGNFGVANGFQMGMGFGSLRGRILMG